MSQVCHKPDHEPKVSVTVLQGTNKMFIAVYFLKSCENLFKIWETAKDNMCGIKL